PAAPTINAPTVPTTSSVETPKVIKSDDTPEPVRAKPSPEPNAAPDRRPEPIPAVSPNAPDFFVTDPAGYPTTIDQYRGHVVVIAIWSMKQPDSISLSERLYKTYASNPKFRFLGVTNERQARPANTTFPVLYNQGSKLLGAQPGQFV